MDPIEDIVERVSDLLGGNAGAGEVEALASSLLEKRSPHSAFVGGRLHVCLSDCSSRLPKTVRSRAYDKIRRAASHGASALRKTGFGEVLRISTTPLTAVAGTASASDHIVLAQMLDDTARDCSASAVEGLAALVLDGIGGPSDALLSVVPEVLHSTTRVLVDVLAASATGGINLDAVHRAIAGARRFTGPSEDVLRFRLLSSIPDGSTASDAELFVRADTPVLIGAAFRAAPDASISELSAILKATAFALGRGAASLGSDAARIVGDRSGLTVRFGGIDVDPGGLDARDPFLPAALAAAAVEGFRMAAGAARLLPQSCVLAFTSSTSDAGAGARLVDELARAGPSPIALHPLFVDRPVGERVQVDRFEVLVEEPPERDWFLRGGQIPLPS